MSAFIFIFMVLAFIGLSLLARAVNIVNEYERVVVFTLGRASREPRGPGLVLILPVVQRAVRIDQRVITLDVPPQDIITRDNVSLRVNAVVYFRVINAVKSVCEVGNYMMATSQMAQTTLRSVLGQVSLDDLLAEREKLNSKLQDIIDQHTEPWGIKVSTVEIKQVDLPPDMQRAMAMQAEAEREKRAKIIHAEGERTASEQLRAAAQVLSQDPTAIQLRYLQTLIEIGSEKNTTVVFPIPINFLDAFQPKKPAGQ
jgi:regulator of protease activity HflC (stomatin/prohibitin superfamily)